MRPVPRSSRHEYASLFSLVYQAMEGDTVVLNDNQSATNRKVNFNMNLPRRSLEPERRRGGDGQRAAGTESLHSIDSRQEANLAYQVCYLTQEDTFSSDVDEALPEESISKTPSSRALTWFQVWRSKLLTFGRALRLGKQ
ncbi:hypothetical protein BKA70DRAFT_1418188 [Coprinopsis sp. MPI-PUGE-AT-0042]|nr:hypothetical protein BKA70DRAFT_1418188 [Coprinopsis sp. MPI-PUGE-AT-0042]